MEYDRKIIKERPILNKDLIAKCVAMKSVMSVSCVFTDAYHREGVMDCGIQFRSVNKPFIGPALTVKLTPGDIVDCLPIFDVAQPGDVVVIDAGGTVNTSIWGGLMSGLARNAGIAGAVIDGSARDTDESKMLDFPMASRSVSPRAAHSATTRRFTPIEINVPVCCGGIVVNPGDLIVADEVGITSITRMELAEVYERALLQAEKEELARKDILAGLGVEELLAKYGRI